MIRMAFGNSADTEEDLDAATMKAFWLGENKRTYMRWKLSSFIARLYPLKSH